MKNVWMYHLIADGPMLLFLIYYFETGRPLEALIIFGGFVYSFIYRPIVDYYRLITLER